MNFVFSSHFSHPSSSPTEVLLPSKPCPTLMESFRVWPTGDNYRALSETKSCILENERLALSLTCVRRQTLLSMGWGVNFHTRSTTQCGWVHSCTNNQNTELLRAKALSGIENALLLESSLSLEFPFGFPLLSWCPLNLEGGSIAVPFRALHLLVRLSQLALLS